MASRARSLLALCSLTFACSAWTVEGGGDETQATTATTGTSESETSAATTEPATSEASSTATETTDANETDATETGETETGEPDEALPPGCDCIAQQEFGLGVTPTYPSCGEELCPQINAHWEGEVVIDNPELLSCALMALIERTPGVLRWHYTENDGQFEDIGYLLIHDDGSAVRRDWGAQDLAFEISDAALGELQPAAVFEACLATPDPLTRWDCLRAELESEAAICDEGYFEDSI